MRHVRKLFYLGLSLLTFLMQWAITGISIILHTVPVLGLSVVIIHNTGYWALLLNFLWMSVGTVMILGFSAFLAHHVPRIAHLLGVRTNVDVTKYQSPFWKQVRTKGIFVMTVVVTWVTSPAVAANVLRAFAVPERRAWTYGFISNAIVSTAAVALYHGGAEVVRGLLHLHGSH